MDTLSRLRMCASPRKFDNYKTIKTADEKKPMKSRCLALFPACKPASKRSKKNPVKDKEDALQFLAASIVKMSTNDASKKAGDLTGCQLTEIPGLFAESENEPYRKTDKTGIRVSLEKRYPDAFISPVISSPVTSISIRDGMQDIFMSPLQHHNTFWDYFELF